MDKKEIKGKELEHVNGGGEPEGGAKIRIRGTNSLESSKPLAITDGIIFTNDFNKDDDSSTF